MPPPFHVSAADLSVAARNVANSMMRPLPTLQRADGPSVEGPGCAEGEPNSVGADSRHVPRPLSALVPAGCAVHSSGEGRPEQGSILVRPGRSRFSGRRGPASLLPINPARASTRRAPSPDRVQPSVEPYLRGGYELMESRASSTGRGLQDTPWSGHGSDPFELSVDREPLRDMPELGRSRAPSGAGSMGTISECPPGPANRRQPRSRRVPPAMATRA